MLVKTLLFSRRRAYPLLEATDSFHSLASLLPADDEDGNDDDDDDDKEGIYCNDHSDF